MYNSSRYLATIGKIGIKIEDYRRFCGVLPETFKAMVIELKTSKLKGRKTGSYGKLCFEDQVLLLLEYYRNYPSQTKLAIEYGVNETTVGRTIKRVEEVLVGCNSFRLPSKKELKNSGLELEAVIVDVTEMQIQRPKRKRFKLGKKNQE